MLIQSNISLLLNAIHRVVKITAGLTLVYMVFLAFTQLILRWFFNSGLGWADLQLRQMVLYIGLLGGVLAAAENRHIKIDLVTHYLQGRARKIAQKFIHLVAAAGCLCLTYFSIEFVISEFQAETVLRGVFFGADIPQGYSQLIIPTAFFLMALFFLERALKPISSTVVDR